MKSTGEKQMYRLAITHFPYVSYFIKKKLRTDIDKKEKHVKMDTFIYMN